MSYSVNLKSEVTHVFHRMLVTVLHNIHVSEEKKVLHCNDLEQSFGNFAHITVISHKLSMLQINSMLNIARQNGLIFRLFVLLNLLNLQADLTQSTGTAKTNPFYFSLFVSNDSFACDARNTMILKPFLAITEM